jgi:ubiquinone/menaquinone biosynthesis C-methylase UbiE
VTFADAKQRFSNRAADYLRYRPGYPAAVLDALREDCGLRAGQVIADIGSGTGFLSELFLKNGHRVYGVEPNAEMRQAGEEYLATYEGFSSMEGSAESTALGDSTVDFVTAGQAFHWFMPTAARKEFSRILRPAGWVVVLWNDRRTGDTAFGRAYESLLERYGTDYQSVKEAYPDQQNMRAFFGEGNFSFRELPNEQRLDWEGLAGRLRSSSYAPAPAHPSYGPMMADLGEIFRANQLLGQVGMQYVTHVYFGRLVGGEHA